ncbi:hypothetical protein JD844_013647 [Phrynosoma platyrhinos]|uniref:EGF-like domain-containing protein n=1 Tax=Phrynosoma platyrhinos TaxID=52577 RepID=A0ABQ7TMA3_PHRPL|nr:hypothetical protein JD844_013647 [Phrynosoma platyrhinos]
MEDRASASLGSSISANVYQDGQLKRREAAVNFSLMDLVFPGKNCQLMDFCPANPCANGGTCVITYPVIVCQCRPGFEGHTCQYDVNECFGDTNPCLNGGQCINNMGSFRCVCPPNSSGPLCQYRLGHCSPEVCLHGGTCHDVDERFHGCLCLPGYTGQYCEVNPDDCVGHQCSNGGTCQDGLGSYSCQCLPGWTGASPCEHGGSCQNTLGSFTCCCPEGYTGSRCESNLNECLSQPCHNGASCLDLLGRFQCLCPSGFEGQQCEREADLCHSSPCGHGTCMNTPSSFTCICSPGFTGLLCMELSDPCQNWQCLNGGWTGQDCATEINACNSSPCHQGGTCLSQQGAFTCLCPSGYQGTTCEEDVDECQSSPCLHSGSCLNSPGSFHCLCSKGYTGLRCQVTIDRCSPSPHCDVDPCSLPGPHCYYGGTCVAQPEGFSCICPPGYVGKRCEGVVDACFSQPCHRPGAHECQSNEHGFHCLCTSGYTGRLCESVIDSCQTNPCHNGGSCSMMPGHPLEFTCHCPQDDPDYISVPDQSHPKPKKQVQFSTPTQAKDAKPKNEKNREPVCGLTPLAHSPGLEVEGSWTDRQTHSSGETPLHLAARFSRADAARRLLTSGADVNARDQWGRTPLHSAIAADALGVFQILLRQRQTDLDASAHDGSTPLILATRLAVENMVEELVANHADVRATDKRGKSALHWAAAVNNVRATLILLRNGADKDAQDNRAQTPLFLAAQEGSYKVASLLLQHGAAQNIQDHLGRLPKDVAQERLHHDILSLLDHPSPSCGTGQLLPHRPRPKAHRAMNNLHRLPGQTGYPRLTPVPENEGFSKELPSPRLPRTLDSKASSLSTLSKKYRQDAKFLNSRSAYAKAAATSLIFVVLMLYIRFWWLV